jgi:membrane associated rhomboid family serine protease
MLPVQDVFPSRSTPWATMALAASLGAVLVFELLLPEPLLRGLILSYGVVPAHLSWPALATSPFLHYGLLDAGINALALWIFGDNVEDRLGRGRYVALFIGAGALSGLAAARLAPGSTTPLIGAAGAVGGIVGAHLVLFPASRVLMLTPVWRGLDLVEVPAGIVVLFWVITCGLLTGAFADPFSDLPLTVPAQASGIVVGAASARLLVRRDRMRCAWWNVRTDQPPDRRRTSRDTSASSASSASN